MVIVTLSWQLGVEDTTIQRILRHEGAGTSPVPKSKLRHEWRRRHAYSEL